MSKVLGLSSKGEMIKIEDTSSTKGYVWYFLADNVKGFAKTIKLGSEVELKVEEKNGQDTVTYIKGGFVKTNNPSNKETKSSEFKCIKCEAPLKDGKYKTCYNCSMEIKEQTANSPEEQSKQTSIVKQAVMKASANAVATAMQGQLDVDTLGDSIIKLYEKLLEKINS